MVSATPLPPQQNPSPHHETEFPSGTRSAEDPEDPGSALTL